MAVLGYLIKSKRGLELTFGARFLHGFLMLMLVIFSCKYSINWQSFNVISFIQDIKQNVLLSSYLDNWWRHKL